jgi:hypothetical protein
METEYYPTYEWTNFNILEDLLDDELGVIDMSETDNWYGTQSIVDVDCTDADDDGDV